MASWRARLGVLASRGEADGPRVDECVIHLIRGTFRYAGRQHRDAIANAIKPIYTAVNAAAAREALDAFDAEWRHRYPAAIRLWRNAWEEFIPFVEPGLRQRDRKGDLFDQRNRSIERPLPTRPSSWRRGEFTVDPRACAIPHNWSLRKPQAEGLARLVIGPW
jgi:hypothetical protein